MALINQLVISSIFMIHANLAWSNQPSAAVKTQFESYAINELISPRPDKETPIDIKNAVEIGRQYHHFQNIGKTNFLFQCPGHSVLNGMQAVYHEDERDYVYKLRCAFLEGDNNQLLMKTACQTDEFEAENKDKSNSVSCNEANDKGLVHRFESRLSNPEQPYQNQAAPEYDPKYGRYPERQFDSSCCKLQDRDNSEYSAGSNCREHKFSSPTTFDFTCQDSKVISKIESKANIIGETIARDFTFTCCNVLKTGSP